jgi:ABC-type Fe3+/spermidine/putrescine transport system ATPase subunit
MVDTQALHIQDLTLRHGDRTVIDAVSLTVSAGHLASVVGPSGCGKTTLLRAVAGLHEVSMGTIRLGDQDMTHRPPAQRGVGMLFQHYALFPNLTVAENVAYGLRARGWAAVKRHARVVEMLELVGLATLSERRPQELSGGQRQRVALARALAPEPALLLMDEPFSALDEFLREELRQAVRRIVKQTGQTCLLVTHDRAEALELSDEVVVMSAGRVLQQAYPSELMQRPNSLAVARFMGGFNEFSPPVTSKHTWVAPMAQLQLQLPNMTCTLQDALTFEAFVDSLTPTPAGLLCRVTDDGGSSYKAMLPSAVFAPSQRVRCVQPVRGLHQVEMLPGGPIASSSSAMTA